MCAAGIARRAFPWRQAKRAAPQARRREGLEPDGRDGKGGAGRSPKSPAVQRTDTPGPFLQPQAQRIPMQLNMVQPR
jgi:hypothetical protein